MLNRVHVLVIILLDIIVLCSPALAANVGDLENNLRIIDSVSGNGCVRPMLIASIGETSDVYTTGSLISSATILKRKVVNLRDNKKADYPESLYFEGGLYFDFKNDAKREKVVDVIKEMIKVHEDNVRLKRETGKEIVYPETDNSIFWGSLIGSEYQWGRQGKVVEQIQSLDKFRFMTMRISVLVPFSEKTWTYDVANATLTVYQRRFHSSTSLKGCGGEAVSGIIDPGSSMEVRRGDGDLFLNTHQDTFKLNDATVADKLSIFNFVIENITSQILKTRETIPMRIM